MTLSARDSSVVQGQSQSRNPRTGLAWFGTVLVWVPVALASGYLIWLVANFPRIVKAIELDPDAAWAPVLALDLASGPEGGLVYVGEASHYTTIWLLTATRGLPVRDLLWEAAPFALFLLGLAFTAWAIWRSAGRCAALLGLSIGVCAGAPILLTVMSEGRHGHTFFTSAVLAAFLVLQYSRPGGERYQGRYSPLLRWLSAAVLVALAGSTLASDPLLLPSGILPFLLAPLAIALVDRTPRNRELAAMAAVIGVLTILTAFLLGRWMHAGGFRKTYATEGYALASPAQALGNLRTFLNRTLELANGFIPGQDLDYGFRDFASIGMTMFLVAAVLIPAIRTVRKFTSDRSVGLGEQPLPIMVAFWVMSLLGTAGAFSLSSFASGPSDNLRYVMPAFFALAAVTVVPARRPGWGRTVVVVGASLFCLLSITNRAALFQYERFPNHQAARHQAAIVSFLENEGALLGYAGYFNSHPLTYASEMRVRVYPVLACRLPVSDELCRFPVNIRTAWYQARSGVRSFLLSDHEVPDIIAARFLPEFGKPSAYRRFGNISVYVFDYDIASRLAAPCPLGSPKLTCPGVGQPTE